MTDTLVQLYLSIKVTTPTATASSDDASLANVVNTLVSERPGLLDRGEIWTDRNKKIHELYFYT